MLSHQLGFTSSWKMLTRDKGWIKPLLLIALVSWVPVVGQLVILGYGLEWARLTAWGVDAAPKQKNVRFGKMFATGGIALLISLIVSAACAGIGYVVFKSVYRNIVTVSGVGDILTSGMLSSIIGLFFNGSVPIAPFLVLAAVNLLVETFVLAAQMRATLYDGFGAGWRFDRLAQMVVRDIGGFLHVACVLGAWSLVSALLDKFVSLCAGMGVMSLGMMGMTLGVYGAQGITLMRSSIVPVLLLALVAVLVLFAFQVVKVALQLVTINTMGQWFQRFDVGRWGVSSAPLPSDVPHKKGSASAAPPHEEPESGQQDAASSDGRPGDAAGAAVEDVDASGEPPVDRTASGAETEEESEPEVRRGPILLGPITTDDSTESPEFKDSEN